MTGISIIIPAYNEATTLPKTLQLLQSCIPSGTDYEILVGDHGSQDGTDLAASDMGVHVVPCLHCRNVAEVRNYCASVSDGYVLVFIDADISVTPQWGQLLGFAAHCCNSGGIVGSRPKPLMETPMNRHWFRRLRAAYLGGAHMMMSRDTFQFLNGFDETLDTGEDVAICRKALANGRTVEIHPELAVYHRRFPETLWEFLKREAWHGMGDWAGIVPKSKTALVAAIFAISFALSFFYMPAFVVSIAILITVTLYKFSHNFRWIDFPFQLFMMWAYLLARFMSIFFQHKSKRIFAW